MIQRSIAVVVGLAAAAEAAPQRIDRHRSEERRARLVEDCEVAVDDLHVVVRAHVAVRIRRRRVDREGPGGSGEALAHAVEVARRRGDQERHRARLHHRIVRAVVEAAGNRLDRVLPLLERGRRRPDEAERRGDVVVIGARHLRRAQLDGLGVVGLAHRLGTAASQEEQGRCCGPDGRPSEQAHSVSLPGPAGPSRAFDGVRPTSRHPPFGVCAASLQQRAFASISDFRNLKIGVPMSVWHPSVR